VRDVHEYSFVLSMFDQIGEIVRANHAVAVRRVRVRIGPWGGVDRDLFSTAYDMCRVETCCGDAPLEILDGAGDELTLEQVELEVP
jgi:Zn finger protein HypA/HybF involved in hydrogenase expression